MTRYQPLYQLAGQYVATDDRQFISGIWPNGGLYNGAVTLSTSAMSVSIAPGKVVVPLQPGGSPSRDQGCAICFWDAAETVTLNPAPGTNTSRIDLIVAKVRDNALDGGGFNDFIFQSVTGTAAASPVAPATPANSYVITRVTVPANVLNLSTATQTPTVAPLVPQPAVGLPVGSSFEWWSNTLPVQAGATFAFMQGQTVSATTYPALAAAYPSWVSGGNITIPDVRSRFFMGTPSGQSPGTLGGSTAGITLTSAQMPQQTVTVHDSGHGHARPTGTGATGSYANWPAIRDDGSTQSAYNATEAAIVGLSGLTAERFTFYAGNPVSNGTTGITATVGNASPSAVPVNPPYITVNRVLRIA